MNDNQIVAMRLAGFIASRMVSGVTHNISLPKTPKFVEGGENPIPGVSGQLVVQGEDEGPYDMTVDFQMKGHYVVEQVRLLLTDYYTQQEEQHFVNQALKHIDKGNTTIETPEGTLVLSFQNKPEEN